MIYSGKQICIKMKNGNEKVFRGSSFTLEVIHYDDIEHTRVVVYDVDGDVAFTGNSDEIVEVTEDSYGNERLK